MAKEIIDTTFTELNTEETGLSTEVEETAEKKDGKVVAAIIGGATVLTGGLAFGGYKIYKNFISKTGRVEHLEKRYNKATDKAAKISTKLDKAKAEIKPNVHDVPVSDKPDTEKTE